MIQHPQPQQPSSMPSGNGGQQITGKRLKPNPKFSCSDELRSDEPQPVRSDEWQWHAASQLAPRILQWTISSTTIGGNVESTASTSTDTEREWIAAGTTGSNTDDPTASTVPTGSDYLREVMHYHCIQFRGSYILGNWTEESIPNGLPSANSPPMIDENDFAQSSWNHFP